MRLLADENVPRPLIAALVALGHDVVAVTDEMAGTDDRTVLATSTAHNRILLTEDRDFGDHAVRDGEPAVGIVLLELHRLAFRAYVERAIDAIEAEHNKIPGALLIIEPSRVRIRPLHGSEGEAT